MGKGGNTDPTRAPDPGSLQNSGASTRIAWPLAPRRARPRGGKGRQGQAICREPPGHPQGSLAKGSTRSGGRGAGGQRWRLPRDPREQPCAEAQARPSLPWRSGKMHTSIFPAHVQRATANFQMHKLDLSRQIKLPTCIK